MTARSKISLTLFLALSAVTASGFAYMTNDTPASRERSDARGDTGCGRTVHHARARSTNTRCRPPRTTPSRGSR